MAFSRNVGSVDIRKAILLVPGSTGHARIGAHPFAAGREFPNMRRDTGRSTMTRIWAHRGARREAPENTLPAFARALEIGADGIELDVRRTADGELVVIHDATIDRTTTGHGPVAALSLAELRSVSASAGMTGFDATVIPTLEEVLELTAPAGVDINIELKRPARPDAELESRVLAAVEGFGVANRTVLSSFDHTVLDRLRRLGATTELALILRDRWPWPWLCARAAGATAIHLRGRRTIGGHFVSRAHAAGVAVRPWVINSEGELDRMFRAGVDAVFTDLPRLAVQVRDGLPGLPSTPA
jgi:glycerophosphoryl diester phosphodiesterase